MPREANSLRIGLSVQKSTSGTSSRRILGTPREATRKPEKGPEHEDGAAKHDPAEDWATQTPPFQASGPLSRPRVIDSSSELRQSCGAAPFQMFLKRNFRSPRGRELVLCIVASFVALDAERRRVDELSDKALCVRDWRLGEQRACGRARRRTTPRHGMVCTRAAVDAHTTHTNLWADRPLMIMPAER